MRGKGIRTADHTLAFRAETLDEVYHLIIESRRKILCKRIALNLDSKFCADMLPIGFNGESAVHQGKIILVVVRFELFPVKTQTPGDLAQHVDVLHHHVSHIKDEEVATFNGIVDEGEMGPKVRTAFDQNVSFQLWIGGCAAYAHLLRPGYALLVF